MSVAYFFIIALKEYSTGVYILENMGISAADVTLGKNMKRGREKGGKCRTKRKKGKKGKRRNKKRK
jgi:hypothetical protein